MRKMITRTAAMLALGSTLSGCATALVIETGQVEMLPIAITTDVAIGKGVAEAIQSEVIAFQNRNALPEYLSPVQCPPEHITVCSVSSGECYCAEPTL